MEKDEKMRRAIEADIKEEQRQKAAKSERRIDLKNANFSVSFFLLIVSLRTGADSMKPSTPLTN